MRGRHLALIVEDDAATADDLAAIVQSLGCDTRVTGNKRDALDLVDGHAFCVVLLDLEIKAEPRSIKGHLEHGNSLLRDIRRRHPEHTGRAYWLPIIVVSGFAREASAAVEAMKDGANDIIHKPFVSRHVSVTIRSALEVSGRTTHNLCGGCPAVQVPDTGAGVVLAIPGDRVRRRTRVMVGPKPVMLPNSSLRVLLQLMVAHQGAGQRVHKRDLGARADQGFKGVSLLREALKPVLQEGVDIIENDYHGFYCLTRDVTIKDCDAGKLADIGDVKIATLARTLRQLLDTEPTRTKGKS